MLENEQLKERIENEAWYIIENDVTIREASETFNVAKSSLHSDVTKRLIRYNSVLANEVQKVLDRHRSEAPFRGGMATKRKREMERKAKKAHQK